MTVSEGLQLQKAIRSRMSDLSALRSQCSIKERFFGNAEKEVTPQYDVKELDSKIVTLEKLLFNLDNAIKSSNAKTDIGLEIDSSIVFEALK